MRRTAAFAISAVLLPATIGLVACSGSSGAAPKAAGTTSAAATAPASATAGQAARQPAAPDQPGELLTGAQLKGVLAPASYFPSGFTSVAAETQDSGDAYGLQATALPPAVQCPLFDTNGIVNITGYSPVAYAQGDYKSKSTSGEYAQEIDEFQGTAAQGLMSTLSLAATACSSYQDSETKTTAHVTQSVTTLNGYPALVFLTSDTAWPGGVTIEAVEVGAAVVTVMVSTGSADNGTKEAAKLAATIVGTLAGKR